jgi:2-alkenal reductase
VNTAIFSPSGANAGIGFAIPIDVVNRIVPELINTGRVPTPGIGILAADEAITAQLGVSGIVIADVVPGSPADHVGIRGFDRIRRQLGDVLTAIDGTPVHQLSDLTDALERLGVGAEARLTVRRGRTSIELVVPIVDISMPR